MSEDLAAVDAYKIQVSSISGVTTALRPFQPTDTVNDVACVIRSSLGIPISVQTLAWGNTPLKHRSQQLGPLFGKTQDVTLTIVRRSFTPEERAELHKRLVRATAAGMVSEARELLREGAKVNFEAEEESADVSLALPHWQEDVEVQAQEEVPAPVQPDSLRAAGDEEQFRPSAEQHNGEVKKREEEDDRRQVSSEHPCGGLSPLMVASVIGNAELVKDFEDLGAHKIELEPSQNLTQAFIDHNFVEIARHIKKGADLNVRMPRGPQCLREWAIWPDSDQHFGTPLHACAAMHRSPGAYEMAQLLIQMRADLNAGDAEGDSPLAHARYFRAAEMYTLLEGKGAVVAGPYFGRFGR